MKKTKVLIILLLAITTLVLFNTVIADTQRKDHSQESKSEQASHSSQNSSNRKKVKRRFDDDEIYNDMKRCNSDEDFVDDVPIEQDDDEDYTDDTDQSSASTTTDGPHATTKDSVDGFNPFTYYKNLLDQDLQYMQYYGSKVKDSKNVPKYGELAKKYANNLANHAKYLYKYRNYGQAAYRRYVLNVYEYSKRVVEVAKVQNWSGIYYYLSITIEYYRKIDVQEQIGFVNANGYVQAAPNTGYYGGVQATPYGVAQQGGAYGGGYPATYYPTSYPVQHAPPQYAAPVAYQPGQPAPVAYQQPAPYVPPASADAYRQPAPYVPPASADAYRQPVQVPLVKYAPVSSSPHPQQSNASSSSNKTKRALLPTEHDMEKEEALQSHVGTFGNEDYSSKISLSDL